TPATAPTRTCATTCSPTSPPAGPTTASGSPSIPTSRRTPPSTASPPDSPWSGGGDAGGLDEPDDPATVAAERFEQLQHLGVGAAALAGERERDQVLHRGVAHGHGVGVAQRGGPDQRRRPDADAGHRAEPLLGLVGEDVDQALDGGGAGR